MSIKKKGEKRVVHETVIREVIEKPVRRKRIVRKKVTRRKSVVKKIVERKIAPIKPPLPKSDLRIERALIENFVGLQKVMVNLSARFDELTEKISKLLDLFEISAKALAEKDITMEKTERDDTHIIKKMDNMFEQNRVLARGLTLINQKLDEEPGYPNVQTPKQPQTPPIYIPTNKPPIYSERTTIPIEKTNMAEYQPSSLGSKPLSTFKKLPKP